MNKIGFSHKKIKSKAIHVTIKKYKFQVDLNIKDTIYYQIKLIKAIILFLMFKSNLVLIIFRKKILDTY